MHSSGTPPGGWEATGGWCMSRDVSERRDMVVTQKKSGRAETWRERVEADLAAQVEAGGTLYGYRKDGACVARTGSGDRVIMPVARKIA